MVKRIIILYIGLLSVICLNQRLLNICSLSYLVDKAYLVETAIHLGGEYHEEDNLSYEFKQDYNSTMKQFHFDSLFFGIKSGIMQSIWQPPECLSSVYAYVVS